jgi:hypothetical protein
LGGSRVAVLKVLFESVKFLLIEISGVSTCQHSKNSLRLNVDVDSCSPWEWVQLYWFWKFFSLLPSNLGIPKRHGPPFYGS